MGTIREKDTSNINQLNEIEQKICKSYPYIIARPFYEMICESNYFIKINLLKDVIHNIFKYLGFITIAEYLSCENGNSEIDSLFEEKLQLPQFGHWSTLIGDLLKYLNEIDHNFVVSELYDTYFTLHLGKGKRTKRYKIEMAYTDEIGETHFIVQNVTAIDALINLRNKYIGHNMVLSETKSKNVYDLYYPILLDLLKQIEFSSSYPMVSQDYLHYITWMGIEPDIETSDKTFISDQIFLKAKKSNLIIPDLFIFYPKKKDFQNKINHLYLYEKINNNCAVFVSEDKNLIELPLIRFRYYDLIYGMNKPEPEVEVKTDNTFKDYFENYEDMLFKLDKEANGVIIPDETDKDIIDNYPYLIALPYKKILNQKKFIIKIQLMKDVLLNTLKYLGLITVTEYLNSNKTNKDVNRLFREKLYRPQFGHWNHFIRETIQFLTNEKYDFVIPQLAETYIDIELSDHRKLYRIELQQIDDFGDVSVSYERVTALSALINFRNRYIGHSVTLKEDQSKKVFCLYYPILKDLLSKFSFCKEYPMLKFNRGKTWSLMSSKISALDDIIKPDNKQSKLWLQISNHKQLHLQPFFILPKQYIAGVLDNVEMFIYEQYTGKRILYFSPESESGETSGDVVEQLNRLLKSKEKETPIFLDQLTQDVFKNRISEETHNTKNQLVNDKKVIPGVYQPRLEAETSIRKFIYSEKILYFLAADAGSGKTNLLYKISNILEQDKLDVLFLRAGRLETETLKKTLTNVLNINSNTDFSKSKLFQRSTDDPFFIILDGVNEHQAPEILLKSCFDLLKEIESSGIKIIISWRVYSSMDLPKINSQQEKYFFSAVDNPSPPKKYESKLVKYVGWLKAMDKKETVGAWTYFKKHRSKKFRPQFEIIDIESKDREFTNQLSNPLHLRLFLELYNNKGLKKTGKLLRIWPAWLDFIEQKAPGATSFINKLVAIMYARNTNRLELDSLFDEPDLGDRIRDLNIDSPFQKLLKRGVLTLYFENDLPVIEFTIESTWIYLLSLFINSLPKADTGMGLLHILEEKKELKGIEQAIGFVMRDDAISKKYMRLIEVIETKEPDELAVAIPALVYMVENQSIEPVFDSLMKDFSIISMIPFYLVSDILHKKLNNNKSRILFQTILESSYSTKFSNWEKAYIMNKVADDFQKLIQFDESLKYFAEASELVSKEVVNEPTNAFEYELRFIYIEVMGNYAKLLASQGEQNRAISITQKLISFIKNKHRKNFEYLATLEHNIGSLYAQLGDFEHALEHLLNALKSKRWEYGEDHPETVTSLLNLGSLYIKLEQYNSAEEYYLKSKSIIESHYGLNHPLTATIYNRIGLLSKNRGDFDASLEYSNRSITILKRLFGGNCCEQLEPLNNIGTIFKKTGRLKEAENTIKRAIEICENAYGNKHLHSALIYSNLADLFQKKNNLIEAEYYYDKSLQIRINLLGDNHYKTSQSYLNKGNIYSLREEYTEAIKWYRKAQLYTTTNKVEKEFKGSAKFYHTSFESENVTNKIGKEHLAKVSNNIAGAYYNMKKYEEAIAYFNQAETLFKEAHGDDYTGKADLNYPLAICYYELEQYAAAVDCYEIVLSIKLSEMGEENVYIGELLARLATSKYLDRRNVESIPYATKALQIYAKFPDEIDHLLNMFSLIGHAYYNCEDYDNAELFFLKTVELKENNFAFPCKDLIKDYRNLKAVYWEKKNLEKSLFYASKEFQLVKVIYKSDAIKIGSVEIDLNKIKSAIAEQDNNQQDTANSRDEIRNRLDKHKSIAKEHFNNERYADAKIFYQKILEENLHLFEYSHEEVAYSFWNVANCDYHLDNYEEAIEVYSKVIRMLIELFGEFHADVHDCYYLLGLCYYWSKEYSSAVKIYQKVMSISIKLFGEESNETDEIRFDLAKAYYYADFDDSAKKLFDISYQYRKEAFGVDSNESNEAKEWMDEFE